MFDNIQPGTRVSVTVKKTPKREAAAKTIVRVLSKDPGHANEHRRNTRTRWRHYAPKRRGGRLYSGRMPKLHRLKGEVGETGTVLATLDVIRDLNSVESFIEVKPA